MDTTLTVDNVTKIYSIDLRIDFPLINYFLHRLEHVSKAWSLLETMSDSWGLNLSMWENVQDIALLHSFPIFSSLQQQSSSILLPLKT